MEKLQRALLGIFLVSLAGLILLQLFGGGGPPVPGPGAEGGPSPAGRDPDRPWAGFRVQPASAEQAATAGAEAGVPLVTGLEAGSPAERAGLRPGDAIVRANGTELRSPDALSPILGAAQPGAVLQLVLRRGGQSVDAAVTLRSKREWELMLGEPAPELAPTGWVGEESPLAKLRGQVVVLFFFQMIEKPSQDFHNQVEFWFDRYKGKAVRFVGAHLPLTHPEKQSGEAVRAFVQERQFSYPVALLSPAEGTGQARVALDYRLTGTPTIVVVDAEGVVRYKTKGRPSIVDAEKAIDLLLAGMAEK
ncbi:MAG: PDZ domain-containing protein [Planctomycetes bacterium]|nr:PDZ domain-containing protein [Planctomycetota bacterium]